MENVDKCMRREEEYLTGIEPEKMHDDILM